MPDPSTAVPHRIGRLRFEIDGDDEASLLSVRAEIVDGAEDWLPEALDDVLGALDDPSRTIAVDRLEIDLGVLPATGLTSELLTAALNETLTRQLGESNPGLPPARVSNRSHDLTGAVRFFLERGRLPWWSPVQSIEGMEHEISNLRRAAIRRLARAVAPALHLARAARRLVIEVKPEVVVLIVGSLPGAPPSWLDVAALDAARDGGDIEALAASVSLHARADTGRRGMSVAEHPAEDPTDAAGGRGDRSSETADPEAAEADAAIVVSDAGLVIVHPFLGEFFAARGLAEGGRFVGEGEQQRAVRLTAHLARGDGTLREPELAVSKLLCGWPLDEPVVRHPGPSAEDRAEAEALLRAVVEHWTAIGRSSPVALRETFLHRPGRLAEDRDGWRLEVERRGPDVLLDRLPWSVSTVFLPWMVRPLSVEWV